jgi:hypothetical protein
MFQRNGIVFRMRIMKYARTFDRMRKIDRGRKIGEGSRKII